MRSLFLLDLQKTPAVNYSLSSELHDLDTVPWPELWAATWLHP